MAKAGTAIISDTVKPMQVEQLKNGEQTSASSSWLLVCVAAISSLVQSSLKQQGKTESNPKSKANMTVNPFTVQKYNLQAGK